MNALVFSICLTTKKVSFFSMKACATFNFLNAEGRMAACALIPPLHISYNENDVLQTKLKQKQLYETE